MDKAKLAYSLRSYIEAWFNKDDLKYSSQKKFEKLAKEKFDEAKELTYKINRRDLGYYFRGNTANKDLMISIMV